ERFIAGKRCNSWRDQQNVSSLEQQRPWLASYGQETPLTVPIARQPLTKFLEGAADWTPKQVATIFYGARLSYQQLNWQVNQFAHALLGLGLKPGERVILVLPNMPQLIISYYGTLKTGGVVVLSQPEADAAQIVRQINQTGAKVLVTLREFGGLVKRVREETPLQHVILI